MHLEKFPRFLAKQIILSRTDQLTFMADFNVRFRASNLRYSLTLDDQQQS